MNSQSFLPAIPQTQPGRYVMSGGECQAGPSTPTQREAEDDPEDESRVRKKRAAAKHREWIDYGRWDRNEFSEEDIDKKIYKTLTDLNRDSCLGKIRGLHKNRKSLYRDFQFEELHRC